MSAPLISRPQFPEGYLLDPKGLLSWEQVETRLVEARNYWLCTVRPNQRPHAIPLWGVWVEGKLYFDGSPQTRHARNIAANPQVSVHLESGDQVVILEGTAGETIPAIELAEKIAQAYGLKYASLGYSPAPDSWNAGGLFAVQPRKVIAWTSFTDDPTRFTFGS